MKIYQQLLLLEQELLAEQLLLEQKFRGLSDIKQILSRLDLTHELPNDRELRSLCRLLEDLKGDLLTEGEYALVRELAAVRTDNDKNRQHE